jgi:hypothetical protein
MSSRYRPIGQSDVGDIVRIVVEKRESCRRMGRKTRRDYAWDLKKGSVSCYL